MRKPIIGYVGMSHLGLNYAVATANKKFKVYCFDENDKTIEILNKKKSPIYEKNLDLNIKKNFDKLNFTTELKKIYKCDIVFISQDVPTNNEGKSNLKGIKKIINLVLRHLNKKAILVILCQVPPGFCRNINWSKKQLYYQVETLIFGKALERASSPERFIIGCYKVENKISKVYENYLKIFKCPIIKMNYESAELAKISINIYLISAITTSNILSEISEKVNANWKDIIPSLQLDKRIGRFAYLNPGLGISGGNLERDLNTLSIIQKNNKINNKLLNNLKQYSKLRKNWILNYVKKISFKYNLKTISILGLAYKEGTHSIKNSPAINLITNLKKFKLKVYDPIVKVNFKNKNITICRSVEDSIKNIDLLIIATPWSIFKKINLNFLKKNNKLKIVIDPFSLLNSEKLSKKGIKQISMGIENDL